MRTRASVLFLCAPLFLAAAPAAEPVTAVRGVVKDEGGRSLAEVKVQLCGLEKFHGGTWTRELRLGWMPSYATDKDGRFAIPFHEPNIRYDLYFDKPGFAPTFLYGVSSSSPELNVVMQRGLAVAGTVKRRVGVKLEPVSGTTVELRLPYVDLWYQQRTLTDDQGRYSFRVTPAPAGRKWQAVFAGEVIQFEVKEGEPVSGPDFEIGAKASDKECIAWVEGCLKDFASLKPGMSRQEVEGKFKLDGGLQSASPVRLTHPACPFFKITVEFDFKRDRADQGRAITAKDDKVIRVSTPYLEAPVMD